MPEAVTQDSIDTKALIAYLRQQQSKGETHVHLDEQAKLILREFYLRAKGLKPAQTTKTTPAAQTNTNTNTTAEKATPQPPVLPTSISAQGSNNAEKIQSLISQAQASADIKQLGTLRDTLVFSGGNPNAKVMFIGDTPGYHEEKQQTPFAGLAGNKLDGILRAMGLSRDDVYLTYLVKYRPMMENQTTNNRKPSDKEIEIFAPYLEQEIQTISPKSIVTLGSLASSILLKSDQPIDLLRGKKHLIGNIPTRATYHPSYLLSNESNEDKRKLWEDMLDVMTDLEMPISSKQQGFFKTA